MTKTNGEYKQYSWNRNASTHKNAIQSFALFAFFLSTVAMLCGLMIVNVTRSLNTIEPLILFYASLCGFVMVWFIFFIVLVYAYAMLNQAQVTTPPTPKKTVIQNKHEWVQYGPNKVKRTQGKAVGKGG